ncbi:MAG: cytochrome c [Acidobacteria bacterium]|nr:cytochrome c [Acidobacteriota bacterium]
MGKYLIALIIGIILVPTAFYLYLRSGDVPVATSASPLPFERFFAKLAMHATMAHQLPKTDAGPPTETDLVSGAQIYRQNCAVCHGLPNKPPTIIAKGMYPHPPQFFHSRPIPSYDSNRPYRPASRKVYWKVKNGVRLTGMPGFKGSFTEQQLWQVSQFLSNARNLPAAAAAAVEGKPQEAQQRATVSRSRQTMPSNHK